MLEGTSFPRHATRHNNENFLSGKKQEYSISLDDSTEAATL